LLLSCPYPWLSSSLSPTPSHLASPSAMQSSLRISRLVPHSLESSQMLFVE
jgi:hypothetical protein